jgi:hypothetical protein
MAPRSDADTPRAKELRRLLEENGHRRKQAREQLDDAREELPELLSAGRKAGLTVASMSRAAGVSRETAHALLPSRT